jgi:hypothetical protein
VNDSGAKLMGDGGEGAEAPVLVSRDLARRMAAYARYLPRRVAEENESVVLEANGPTFIVGAVDPHNFLAVSNVARALHVGTNMITTTRLTRNQFRILIGIAYPSNNSTTIEPDRSDDETPSPDENRPPATAGSPHATVAWGDIDPRAATIGNESAARPTKNSRRRRAATRARTQTM